MSKSLKLYELTLSPNSQKVRIALGYKGIPHERIPLNMEDFPGDRSQLVKLSGQPRTPVIEHGHTVVFDSGGIVRYLEANFRDTPPLFSDDYATHGEIEQWEQWARTDLGPPIGMLFGQAFAPKADPAVIEQANASFREATGRLEGRLAESACLVRATPSAADVAIVPGVSLAFLSQEAAATNPIATFFHAHLKLGDDRKRTRAWAEELLAHDAARAR